MMYHLRIVVYHGNILNQSTTPFLDWYLPSKLLYSNLPIKVIASELLENIFPM